MAQFYITKHIDVALIQYWIHSLKIEMCKATTDHSKSPLLADIQNL